MTVSMCFAITMMVLALVPSSQGFHVPTVTVMHPVAKRSSGCSIGSRTTEFRTARANFPTHLHSSSSSSSSSSSDYSGSDGDSNSNENESLAAAYWKTPNDFSMFLTQRSIQSFMFLTSQLRDPETCYWVEDFTQPNLVPKNRDTDQETNNNNNNSNSDDNNNNNNVGMSDSTTGFEKVERTCHLLRYHGLAAMDTTLFPTWEDYFESMLEEPTDSWIIASEQKHIPDYTWDLDPMSLCSRILSVREQLSKEFAKDLQAVSDMGGQTFDWYWERLKNSRNSNNNSDSDNNSEGSETSQPFTESSSLKGSRENLLFLEINVDDPTLDHKPSPLRRSNFDLLVLLATEEAIHRVLNRWERKRSEGDLIGAEHASHVFLEEFYQERQDFFHGPLPSYGKADDLLEELLDSALLFKDTTTSSSTTMDGVTEPESDPSSGVVHPTKIAELVLKERERVALDWMEIAKKAPMHHMRIQKLRLEKIMSPSSTSSSTTTSTMETNNGGGLASETRSQNNGGFDPGPGAFE